MGNEGSKQIEFRINKRGHKIYGLEAKRRILAELDQGKSSAEVSREYGVPIRYFQEWRKSSLQAAAVGLKSNEEVIPFSEYKKLLEEKRKLERSLGKMTMERDILKDAVEIASKKKWI